MSPSPQPPQLDTPPEAEAAPGSLRAGPGGAGVGAVGTAKGETTELELSRVQHTFARRVAESQATIPQLTLRVAVDLEGRLAGREDGASGCTAEIVTACALALREHPRVNSTYRDGRVLVHSRVNVGVAVAIDAGAKTGTPGEASIASDAGVSGDGTETIAPTVFDADTLAVEDIASQIADLRVRAHAGTLTPPQLSGATFTVVDLGEYGVDSFAATVQPGQAAILAVGAVRPRPVASHDGRVVVRRTAVLTLSCDHRVLYGADAARFLARIRELLDEAPATLQLR